MSDDPVRGERGDMAALHLRAGCWLLLAFLTLGLVLESLHGFKVRLYLDVANETRRLLWTLAHAHGVLLALVNIAFAAVLRAFPELRAESLALASRCLLAGALLLPAGFFLGGVVIYAGDPGLGVALVPLGALLLLLAVFQLAREVQRSTGR